VKIPATLQPLIDTSRNPIPSLLKQLQVGQTLEARVLQQVQPGLLRLQIATTELLARSRVMLSSGTRLQLEVIKGQPLPELRVLRESTALDRQQDAVRSAMSRQLPPNEVREKVSELLAQTQTSRQAAGVRQLNHILQNAGVQLNQLTPAQLRRAIEQSGLFHESRLASGLPFNPADTKTLLLHLLANLRSAGGTRQESLQPPPGDTGAAARRDSGGDSLLARLTRLIEASVSRIQLQQAATLPAEESPRQAWQIDLAILLPDEAHDTMLRIEREEGSEDTDGASTWAVNLAFQFDSIGTLQTRIALAGERVSVTFWSAQDTTHRRIEQRLPNLKEAFEAQGLEVVHLAGVLGAPSEPLIKVPMPESLLDERA
jgi:hypothetical protein